MSGPVARLSCYKLVCLIHTVTVYAHAMLSFISTLVFRLRGDDRISLTQKCNNKVDLVEAEPKTEHTVEGDATKFRDFEGDSDEVVKKEVCLSFKFPTYKDFCQDMHKKSTDYEVFPSESGPVTTSIDEAETFPVKKVGNFEEFCVDGKEKQILDVKTISKGEEQSVVDESVLFSETSSVLSDSNFESSSSDHVSSMMSGLVDSYVDGLLSDRDFEGEWNMDSEEDSNHADFEDEDRGIALELNEFHQQTLENNDELSSQFLSEKDFHETISNTTTDAEFATKDDTNMDSDEDSNHADFEDEDCDIAMELNEFHQQTLENNDELSSQFLSEKDFHETISKTTTDAEFATKDDTDTPCVNSEYDYKEHESLWEHQDLIEQLKMEIKKVRATGLPTILEESDSQKIFDDLRPWKIEEFQREDCIGELHKFYKSYKERMRKFDIMNYQKMYAMGFLQLKDPLLSMSTNKPSSPTLKSLVAPNLCLSRLKIHDSDPKNQFIEELHGDLEMVYVGQMCLSWEFLHWQYEKALDLWDSVARRSQRYNEVAGEFQQFQVLMQRFIEDEPFQGPRVKNYIRSRSIFRNLLQVPVIKQDNLKDKRKARRKDMDEYVITSDTLLEIVEESIRIFWRFVQTDKDCSTAAINSHKKLPDEEDLKLLLEAKKILHKKEKKLRNLLRSENWVLRKLRRCGDGDDSDQVLCFFSQVDVKLVSRVLNMSKITRDQLVWCHSKLDRISFHNRKINVEPAFLLFPC